MTYLGRPIHRFVAVLYQMDAAAMGTINAFDDDFHIALPGKRREKAALRLRCQIDRTAWGRKAVTLSGQEVFADLILTFAWADLVAAGLVDATSGRPTIDAGDRIDRIERTDGTLEEAFPNPPGMFVEGTERVPGIGAFGTPRTNLLYVHCAFARKGAR